MTQNSSLDKKDSFVFAKQTELPANLRDLDKKYDHQIAQEKQALSAYENRPLPMGKSEPFSNINTFMVAMMLVTIGVSWFAFCFISRRTQPSRWRGDV